jgi:hypothetical protein
VKLCVYVYIRIVALALTDPPRELRKLIPNSCPWSKADAREWRHFDLYRVWSVAAKLHNQRLPQDNG